MQVGNYMVKNEQKQHARPEPRKRWEKRQSSHRRRLLNGGNKQAPNRSRNHNPGSEARKGTLHQIPERPFHEEHAGSTERRAHERNQNSENRFYLTRLVSADGRSHPRQVAHLFPESAVAFSSEEGALFRMRSNLQAKKQSSQRENERAETTPHWC